MSRRTFAPALFLAGMAFLLPPPADCQAAGGSGQRLEGTWVLTGTAGPVLIKSITTYLPDGAAFGANSNTFQALQVDRCKRRRLTTPPRDSGSEPATASSPALWSTWFLTARDR